MTQTALFKGTLFLVLCYTTILTDAWIQPQTSSRTLSPYYSTSQRSPLITTFMSNNDSNSNNNGGPLSFLFNPYDSKIPRELKDEIYAAEAKTQAAKDRGTRIALYATIAFTGIVLAFFSAFVTELRNAPLPPGVETGDPLTIAGFDWVRSNPITAFLFTNKIGGGICLLGGAGAGLLAEAELDTKRINAEKIFEEMERRRLQKQKKSKPKAAQKSKKKRSGKERKRSKALLEVFETEEPTNSGEAKQEPTVEEKVPAVEEKSPKEDGGIFGKVKGFYEKADAMAASQALLLNKELEDRGIVEKITDESGLKVIGRGEAAQKGKEKEPGNDDKS